MAITVERHSTEFGLLLLLAGRMDAETAPDFDRICDEAIAPGVPNLFLDFSGLQYISSAGLSSVLMAGKAMEARGGHLVLCGLTGRLKQIFLFSGLDALFPIFEDREEALRQYQTRAAGH